jgi:hypothetical protein
MPTDREVNANRGSLDCDGGGQPEGEASDTFLDQNSFEPRDCGQGRVRMRGLLHGCRAT